MPGMPYFPIFIDLSDKKVFVVGAGTIAKRRIRTLLDFTRDLTVIAPEVNPELKELAGAGRIKLLQKHYQREDLFGADLVIAATNDNRTNQDIYAACKCLGIPVNVCSDKTKCDFFFPGVVRRDHVVVGITASGRDHKEARRVTERIEQTLEERADEDAG